MVFHKKHREALTTRLGKAEGELTANDVQATSKLFRCKECGSRGDVTVREVERRAPRMLYVAGGRTQAAIPIFHKDSCGWVGHVHKASIIEFESREAAVDLRLQALPGMSSVGVMSEKRPVFLTGHWGRMISLLLVKTKGFRCL